MKSSEKTVVTYRVANEVKRGTIVEKSPKGSIKKPNGQENSLNLPNSHNNGKRPSERSVTKMANQSIS